uniref:hypothetical protein n=1 Tax=Gluconobacter thailandicus TaxID=257438 RepID=UPI001E5299D1
QFSKITVSNRPGQALQEGPAASVNGLIRPLPNTVKQLSYPGYPHPQPTDFLHNSPLHTLSIDKTKLKKSKKTPENAF